MTVHICSDGLIIESEVGPNFDRPQCETFTVRRSLIMRRNIKQKIRFYMVHNNNCVVINPIPYS